MTTRRTTRPTSPRRRALVTVVAFGAACGVAGLAVLPAALPAGAVTAADRSGRAHARVTTPVTTSGHLSWQMVPAAATASKPLGGFTLLASSSPVTTQFYEQAIPIPADPQAEVHLSYSQAGSSTGPSNRGLASSLWPGAAVGDGYSTIVGTLTGSLPIPADVAAKIFGNTYPVQANTTYPAGPPDATMGNAPGPYSVAHADDKGATATSTYAGQSPIDNAAAVKGALSDSKASATDTLATASTEAKSAGITLAGGVIDVGAVDTKLSAKSDGATGDASGTTTVTGFSVLGQQFSVDDTGVHAAGTTLPSLLQAVLPTGNALLSTLGITVAPPTVKKTINKATAGITASGMTITVDTTQLNTVLSNPVIANVITQVASQLPPQANQLAEALYALETAAPKIVYIIGDATVTATASPAYDFNDGGAFGPPTSAPSTVTASVPPNSTPPAGSSGGGVLPPSNEGTGIEPGGPAPTVAPPATQPITSTGNDIALPGGKSVPAGLVVGALALAGLLGWGLRWFALAALGAGGAGCELGAPVGVPNLREQ
ncbi:MAG TPA: hypothetical protein VHE83_12400 [Mycobacteriales bacterium]|nr:hypothetical protein [Mycobacteriales bacterium]